MPTFEYDEDYEDAANRSYELSITKGHEYRSAMALALGNGELSFVGAAREDTFYSNWKLVEDVLKEIEGKDMVHLTISASYEARTRRYAWQPPDLWEVTVTHKGGCHSRYFYT